MRMPHLSTCYRVCIRSRQSLGSWVFGVRVRERFVRRVDRAQTLSWVFFGSFAAKKKISSRYCCT